MAFKCPYCGNEGPPMSASGGLNSGGWAVFIILLLFCLPLCWLPFVIGGCKEEIRRCANCGTKLG